MFNFTRRACSIPDGDTVVVTGGDNDSYSEVISRVSRYNRAAGWVGDLPNLVTGRASHGCSTFTLNDRKVG